MPSFARDTRGGKTRLSPAFLLVWALCLSFAGSASAAAPNWLEPADLSKPGRDANNPAVAMDGAGNTVAIWERKSEVGFPSNNLQISTRPAGGPFTSPVDFSLNGTNPQLAMTPAGEAVAVWRHFENPPGTETIKAAIRPPGGSFSAPTTVYTAPPNVFPGELRVAVGAGGDVVVTWTQIDPQSIFKNFPEINCGKEPNPPNAFIECPNPAFVMASVRPAGGVFTEAQRISAPPSPRPEGEPATEEWAKEESAKAAGGGRPTIDPAGNATVVWTAFNGDDYVIQTAYRPAGGSFTAPTQVSESGEDAFLAEIGVDAAGNAIASWLRNDGADRIVQAAVKAPGGAFTPLGDVSPADGVAEGPVLDVAGNGTATIVWALAGSANTFLQSSTKPAGGSFSPPANINNGKDSPLFQEVAVSEEGDAIVVWSGENGANEIVRAAVRTAGASAFGPPVAISQISPDFFHPRPSMDAGGDATVVWVRSNGDHRIVQWAGYDADPPQLRDVSIPSSAKVADTVLFSASAFDVWPVGVPSFEFGDGARAEGSAVSHAYSAPGSYPVRVSVTDAGGRTTSSSATLLVKARNYFTLGKLKRNRRKGTATLSVTIPEPGSLTASARGIKRTTVRSAKGATVKIPLRGAGKGLKRLNKKGKLKAKLKIAYSPVGGDTNTLKHAVTLKKTLARATPK